MKKLQSEEITTYSAGTVNNNNSSATLLNARIKLAGIEVPSQVIANVHQLESFASDLIGDLAIEEFHIICVDNHCQVIAESMISTGDINSCNAPISKIAKIALLANATGIFLTHNHPGGACYPSREDIQTTITIKNALKIFDIEIFDHLIVTQNNGCYSLRQHGDF